MALSWFSRIFGGSPPEPPPSPLHERVGTLEREVRDLRLEWLELYEKVHRQLGRIAKRAALELERQQPCPEDAPGSTNGEPAGVGVRLGQYQLLRAARQRR